MTKAELDRVIASGDYVLLAATAATLLAALRECEDLLAAQAGLVVERDE